MSLLSSFLKKKRNSRMLHQNNADYINTIYINNLNEKIKIKDLKRALQAVFAQFGNIVDIFASKNLKMRGQAFVAFKEKKGAIDALRSMQGFPFFDKPLKIQLAKTDSDCIAKIKGTYIKREKTTTTYRINKKEASIKEKSFVHNPDSPNNALQPSHQATNKSSNINLPAPNQHLVSIPPPLPLSSTSQKNLNRPLMYVFPVQVEPPSNNILFLTNLPPDTNEMLLSTLFGRFSGFREIRTVSSREEIAFVEFDDVASAECAKNALQGYKLSPTHSINISFAKK
nr:U1 small nuclear ribonucleoprotein A [Parasteatoda tepidariorum]